MSGLDVDDLREGVPVSVVLGHVSQHGALLTILQQKLGADIEQTLDCLQPVDEPVLVVHHHKVFAGPSDGVVVLEESEVPPSGLQLLVNTRLDMDIWIYNITILHICATILLILSTH